MSISYSECASVALVIQYAKCLHRNTLLSVAFQTVQYFFTLSHKRHDFKKKVTESKVCI